MVDDSKMYDLLKEIRDKLDDIDNKLIDMENNVNTIKDTVDDNFSKIRLVLDELVNMTGSLHSELSLKLVDNINVDTVILKHVKELIEKIVELHELVNDKIRNTNMSVSIPSNTPIVKAEVNNNKNNKSNDDNKSKSKGFSNTSNNRSNKSRYSSNSSSNMRIGNDGIYMDIHDKSHLSRLQKYFSKVNESNKDYDLYNEIKSSMNDDSSVYIQDKDKFFEAKRKKIIIYDIKSKKYYINPYYEN